MRSVLVMAFVALLYLFVWRLLMFGCSSKREGEAIVNLFTIMTIVAKRGDGET